MPFKFVCSGCLGFVWVISFLPLSGEIALFAVVSAIVLAWQPLNGNRSGENHSSLLFAVYHFILPLVTYWVVGVEGQYYL